MNQFKDLNVVNVPVIDGVGWSEDSNLVADN